MLFFESLFLLRDPLLILCASSRLEHCRDCEEIEDACENKRRRESKRLQIVLKSNIACARPSVTCLQCE